MLSRVASQPIIQHFFQFETFQKLSLLLLSSGRFSSLQTFLPEFSLHQKITYDYRGEGGCAPKDYMGLQGGWEVVSTVAYSKQQTSITESPIFNAKTQIRRGKIKIFVQ